ncbi:MAG: L-asparaginase II, partial [Myxococcota bacterium]
MTVRSVRDVRPLLIRAHRGPGLEAEHPVSAVLSDTTGRVLRSIGPDMTTTWRSAAKPFQLEGSLSLLPPATRQALDAVDLSLGAASHSAQPAHIERVRDLMRRLGVTEDQLQCGGHWPMHTESTHALLRGEGHCTAIHNNCSGKHAFMVAAAQNDGADTDYLDPNHPVQRAIRDRVERYSGHPTDDLGTDGCGAPCFVLPLSAM